MFFVFTVPVVRLVCLIGLPWGVGTRYDVRRREFYCGVHRVGSRRAAD